jgi:hypothetical protein
MVPREVVFGMDSIERKVSLYAAGVAMLVALINVMFWVKNTPWTTTQKLTKGNTCPTLYHLVKGQCENVLKNAQSHWATQFVFIFAIALIILFFALRRKRAGVACFACFLGVALQIEGIVFLFLGVWLIVRAFRLQRYGEASWSGSNKAAREIAQAKKEGRAPVAKSTVMPASGSASASAPPPGPVAPPSASKRYTPKQKPRKR